MRYCILVSLVLFGVIVEWRADTPENSYHDANGHYTFAIPGDWQRVPDSIVVDRLKLAQQTTQEDYSDIPMVVFQPKANANWFDRPYAAISISKKGAVTLDEIERMIDSGEMTKAMNESSNRSKGGAPPPLKQSSFNKPALDLGTRTIWMVQDATLPDGTRNLVVIASKPTSYGMVTGYYSPSHLDEQRAREEAAFLATAIKIDSEYEYNWAKVKLERSSAILGPLANDLGRLLVLATILSALGYLAVKSVHRARASKNSPS